MRPGLSDKLTVSIPLATRDQANMMHYNLDRLGRGDTDDE
jgi:hypothetical protein